MSARPTGTVTFLFTDIEGSTRRWQDEPEAMRALLVEHDAILKQCIDEHQGLLFKHTGAAEQRDGDYFGPSRNRPPTELVAVRHAVRGELHKVRVTASGLIPRTCG